MEDRIRILILDNVRNKVDPLIQVLESHRFEVEFCNEYNAVLDLAKQFAPDVILTNLIIEGQNALKLIRQMKADLKQFRTRIIVMTSQKSLDNVRESIRAGASDFLAEPIHPKVLLDRIRYQLQDRELFNIDDLEQNTPEDTKKSFQMSFQVARILAESRDSHQALHLSLKIIADDIQSPRVNIIMGDLETEAATVIVSSDDPQLQNIEVDLERYPEVREVMLNSGIIFIKDITQNPLTKNVKDLAKTVNIQSLLVFPIRHRATTIGAMSIRLSRMDRMLSDGQLKVFYLIALMLASKVAARKLIKQASKLPAKS